MANTTIPQHFSTEFKSNWEHLVQQKGGRLTPYCRMENVEGEQAYFNQFGTSEARLITARKSKTVASNETLVKRVLRPLPYDLVTIYDEWDEAYLGDVSLPDSATVQSHAYAAGRQFDQDWINAASGSNYEGVTGSTEVALPTSQENGGANNVLSTVLMADTKRLFMENEAYEPDNPADQLCWALAGQQVEDLLVDSEFQSIDFNSVKALVQGEAGTWMGFKIVRTELLTLDSNDVRYNISWVKSTAVIGSGQLSSKMSIRDDLNEALQIRSKFRSAASRLEEERVVETGCDESP